MTTNENSHSNCSHPKTKKDRAACRRAAKAVQNENRNALQKIVDGYYDCSLSAEEVGCGILALASRTGNATLKKASDGYFDDSLCIEEIAGLANRALGEI